MEIKHTISTKDDLAEFLQSSTCKEIEGFVSLLAEKIKGTGNSLQRKPSLKCEMVLALLDKVSAVIEETPPHPTRSRFGNKAFVEFFDKLTKDTPSWINSIEELKIHQHELSVYFANAFGDRQRIDYGSGHELNFVMFLFCLHKLQFFAESDLPCLVLDIFLKYLSIMRKLQTRYWLEPAGSHGVWGLDDYHFLPFLWGAHQLVGHKFIRPRSVTSKEVIEGYSNEYIYLGCIQFINQVKAGSFFEHSPLLWDISATKTWDKVAGGMIKMFRAEVLGKLPVMKHFFFGNLISFQPSLYVDPHSGKSDEHNHHDEHTDSCCDDNSKPADESVPTPKYRVQSCCVQRIPAVFGAMASEADKHKEFETYFK